jgi:hypothetical protein
MTDYRWHGGRLRTRVQFASDLDRIPGLNGALVSGKDAAARVSHFIANRPVKTVL